MDTTEPNGLPESDAAGEAVAEAESLGAQERWDEARDLLLEALGDHPADARVLCWLGIASQRTGDEGEAYEFFRRALAESPSDPFVLAAAGSGVAAYDDPEAEGALRMAALTAPDFPFARSAYGAYLAREGLFAEAAAELEAARDLAPDDGAVRAELGFAYLLAGRTDDGLDQLTEALSRQEDDAWLRAVYAVALAGAGRHEEAAEELHRASLERVEDVEVQLASALASAAEGWEDEAWNAHARAEQASEPGDQNLVVEVEEALSDGPEAAAAFLREHVGPSLLRERLLQRG